MQTIVRRPTAAIATLSFLLVVNAGILRAQESDLSFGGTVTSAGAKVPNAKVSAKNTVTGQIFEAQTDASGAYHLEHLAPGEYDISVSADGFETKSAHVAASSNSQSMDFALVTSSGTGAPSLSDLGFSKEQTQGSAAQQVRLDKRSHMLKIHQRLGLITAGPLLATIISGAYAGGKQPSSGVRDFHAALGSATAGLYIATASYAIFAPKIPGTETRGPIRLHKALAWIHGPGMVLTPILGAMAFEQKSRGEKIHGIASAHGPVAIVTGAAFGAALLSVSIKF